MNEANMTNSELDAQLKKDRDMDFYTLDFSYFFGCDDGDIDPVWMSVDFDGNGKFKHFNCDFDYISNYGDLRHKPVLVALRNYLINLNLDNA